MICSGATGSARLRTSTAGRVPSAPPATAEGVRTTCASEVSDPHVGSTAGAPRRVSRLNRTCRPSRPPLAAESQRSETEDMNEVEKPQAPAPPRTTAKPAPKPKPSAPKKPASRPATPRTPPSDTPSNTYLGTEGKDFPFHSLVVFFFFPRSLFVSTLLLQLRTLNVRLGFGTSAED